MRRVKVTVCLIFIASCIISGGYFIKSSLMEDHKAPVVSCKEEEITVSVADEDSVLLDGVTAKDNRDGDISKSVRVSSMSHFIEKGKRTITYIVFDKANQAGTAQRTVIYSDYSSPKIRLTKPLRYTINESNSVNPTEYMTAEDCLDGDLTNQIHLSLGDELYNVQTGIYNITVQVSNSAGDVCAIPMELTLYDSMNRDEANKEYPMLSEYIAYTSVNVPIDPQAYLTGVMRGSSEYTFAADGDYIGFGPESIGITSNVDYATPGVYTIDFSYTSEGGVTAITKLYVVVEG